MLKQMKKNRLLIILVIMFFSCVLFTFVPIKVFAHIMTNDKVAGTIPSWWDSYYTCNYYKPTSAKDEWYQIHDKEGLYCEDGVNYSDWIRPVLIPKSNGDAFYNQSNRSGSISYLTDGDITFDLYIQTRPITMAHYHSGANFLAVLSDRNVKVDYDGNIKNISISDGSLGSSYDGCTRLPTTLNDDEKNRAQLGINPYDNYYYVGEVKEISNLKVSFNIINIQVTGWGSDDALKDGESFGTQTLNFNFTKSLFTLPTLKIQSGYSTINKGDYLNNKNISIKADGSSCNWDNYYLILKKYYNNNYQYEKKEKKFDFNESLEDGEYEFYYYSNFNTFNKIFFNFTIDTIAPKFTSSVENGGITNQNVKIKVEEINLKEFFYQKPNSNTFVKCSGNSFVIDDTNGLWKFKAIDKAGNQSEFSFTFDNEKPIVTINTISNKKIIDGSWLNEGVVFSGEDTNEISSIIIEEMIDGVWKKIDGSYHLGNIYYDKRKNSIIYGNRENALNKIKVEEWDKVEFKQNWNINCEGQIVEGQKHLAITGNDYFLYKVDGATKLIFFDKNDLNNYINQKALEFLQSDSKEMFFKEGLFRVSCFDITGNQSEFKEFGIDITLPELKFYKENNIVEDFTNKDIKIIGSDNNQYCKIYLKAEDNIWKEINNEQMLSEALKSISKTLSQRIFYLKVEDVSKNVVIKSIIFDTIAPKFTSSVENGGYSNIQNKINSSDIYLKEFSYQKPNSNTFVKCSGNSFVIDDTNGLWKFKAIDKAGNQSEFSFTFDNEKPIVTIENYYSKENNIYYDNENVLIKCSDNNFENIIINNNLNNNDIVLQCDSTNGYYEIFGIDKAGNQSEKIICILEKRENFGNDINLKNEYKLMEWYEVDLPYYIFGVSQELPNISGKYAFENREDAEKWCKKVEEQYRVKKTQENNWVYVSATNEGVLVNYTTQEDLDKAIEKYALKYISDRKINNKYFNLEYPIIKDKEGNTNEESFVKQNIALPEFLKDYQNLNLFQMKTNSKFKKLKDSNSNHSIILKYIANDFEKAEENKMFYINFNKTLQNNLIDNNWNKQGYYEITEQDMCGNIQKYLIYVDLEAPSILAKIITGTGEPQIIDLNQNLADTNKFVFFLCSLELQQLQDNIDDLLAIKINGFNLNQTYTNKDLLPILNIDNGYVGEYQIIVYDRSGNVLEFQVNIAGKLPSMSYTSLSSNTEEVVLKFRTNDRLNTITQLEIFKLNRNGESTKLLKDSNGTNIDFTNLEYHFTNGGKYYAIMVDRYGRIIKTKPIFYEKGLPIGILNNVENNKATNQEVTFSYFVGNGAIVYQILDDGSKKIYSDYIINFDKVNKKYNLIFENKINYNMLFEIFLYNEVDENLFIEYYFEIDTIIANVKIIDINEKEINKDGYTNEKFKLYSDESDVVIKYTREKSSMTNLYKKGEFLVENDIYHFLVIDRIGNEEEFTIVLDNIVDYEIISESQGVNTLNKKIYNKSIVLKMNELYTYLKVNDIDFLSGNSITEEGVYNISILDKYNNQIDFVIELDFTAPLIFSNVINNQTINQNVNIDFSDGVCKLYNNVTNGYIKDLKKNDEIEEQGDYRVIVSDIVGNVKSLSFIIDKQVDFETNIIDNQVTTSRVIINLLEDGDITIQKNDEILEQKLSIFNEQGNYKAIISDKIGNVITLHFTILNQSGQVIDFKLDNNQIIKQALLNGSDVSLDKTIEGQVVLDKSGEWEIIIEDLVQKKEYTIFFTTDNDLPRATLVFDKKANRYTIEDINKDNVILILIDKYGNERKINQNTIITEEGVYLLKLIDKYGNENVYEFEIKYRLSIWSICLIVISVILIGIIIFLIIRKRKYIKVK